MITSIEFAQLLQKHQKQAPGEKTGFDTALLNLGVALSGKKTSVSPRLSEQTVHNKK